jgi:hypothetical protein
MYEDHHSMSTFIARLFTVLCPSISSVLPQFYVGFLCFNSKLRIILVQEAINLLPGTGRDEE